MIGQTVPLLQVINAQHLPVAGTASAHLAAPPSDVRLNQRFESPTAPQPPSRPGTGD
jgi:hypothetical protein